MNRTEFVEKYNNIVGKALECAEKARREGLLALEDVLDQEKVNARDIFEYGLRFVADGTDRSFIDEILSNIVNQEKDEQLRTLMNIQKRAVLCIEAGDNPRLIYALLNSLADIPLNEDKVKFEDSTMGKKTLIQSENLPVFTIEDLFDSSKGEPLTSEEEAALVAAMHKGIWETS